MPHAFVLAGWTVAGLGAAIVLVALFADFLRAGEHSYSYVARATTPGRFVHPPARAEAMYQPETQGRTATGTLVVRAVGTVPR